jgi:hypothetical protein
MQIILVTVKYTRPSLIISHNTSDSSVDLPVTRIHITNNMLIYITVTGMLRQGNSIVLFVDNVLVFN